MTEDRIRNVILVLRTTMEQCAIQLRGGRSPHEIAEHLAGNAEWAEEELGSIATSGPSAETSADTYRLDALRAAMRAATESSLHPSVKALASLIAAALGEPTEVHHG